MALWLVKWKMELLSELDLELQEFAGAKLVLQLEKVVVKFGWNPYCFNVADHNDICSTLVDRKPRSYGSGNHRFPPPQYCPNFDNLDYKNK